jgi:pyridoxine kinase
MAVLSIQSHVVYGYAGNTAAVFPLQRLGREVWAINTVEFSNHTGYGAWRGKVLGADLAADLVTGLEERGVLNRCEAVLSGYLGDAEVAMTISDAVKKVRSKSPDAIYACDPVMGDVGRGFYVKPDIPDVFKKELIPLADIITPNQFELDAITGIKTKNTADTLKAVKTLHEMGPSVVLVTSYKDRKGELSMFASNKKEIYKITTPELPFNKNVAGTGDLTMAVFLSRYLETKDLKKTLELCTASVFSILEASYNAADKKKDVPIDLKIIDNQKELVSPSYSFKAEKITA